MRYVIIALLAYLAVALQTVFGDVVHIGRVGPHLPVMVAAAIVLLGRSSAALVIVAAIGFVEDALWPGRMGVAMAWYLLLGWGLLEGAERFDLESLNRRVAATGIFSCVLACCIGTTRLALGEPTVGLSEIAAQSAGVGLCTGVVAIPFWLVMGWSESIVRRRTGRYEV